MPNKRQKRNISGLRNQPKLVPDDAYIETLAVVESHSNVEEDGAETEDDNLGLRCPDSMKPVWRAEEDKDELTDDEEDSESDIEGWDDSEHELKVYTKLMSLAIDNGDDPRDEDWVPAGLRRKKCERKGQFHCDLLPNETQLLTALRQLKKGPDMGSKSARTQCRYRKLLADQTSLDRFGFTVMASNCDRHPTKTDICCIHKESSMLPPLHFDIDPLSLMIQVAICQVSIAAPSFDEHPSEPDLVRVREESVTPPLQFDDPEST